MVPEKWSVNRLACELGMDRRVLARKLAGLAPAEERKGPKRTERLFWLKEVVAHVMAPEGEDLDLNYERARLTQLQADKAQLELDETEGVLVRTEVIEPHWQSLVAITRAKLLALPSRAAAAVAGPDQLHEVSEKIRDLVYEAMSELSGSGVPHEIMERVEKANKRRGKNERRTGKRHGATDDGAGRKGRARRGPREG